MTRYRVTRPDGQEIIFDSKSEVTYVRFIYLAGFERPCWIMSRHRSEKAARTGPNQTPAWNKFERHIVATARI